MLIKRSDVFRPNPLLDGLSGMKYTCFFRAYTSIYKRYIPVITPKGYVRIYALVFGVAGALLICRVSSSRDRTKCGVDRDGT